MELTGPQNEVVIKLQNRLELGTSIRSRAPRWDTWDDWTIGYQQWSTEWKRWEKFTSDLLVRLFTDRSIVHEFNSGYEIPERVWSSTGVSESLRLADIAMMERLSKLQSIIERVDAGLFQQVAGGTTIVDTRNVDQRTFDFVANERLRAILVADYTEAQISFNAGAYKAAALLAASVIEGMFLDMLQHPTVTSLPQYKEATRKLRRDSPDICWDRAGLVSLADAAKELGLLHEAIDRLGRGVADHRDTIHPQNELNGRRPQREEADAILHFIPLLYRDLAAMPKDRVASSAGPEPS